MQKQIRLDLPAADKFSADKAICPRCASSISGCGTSSKHTFDQVFFVYNKVAIDLRQQLKLSSLNYARVLLFCEYFDSFNAMCQFIFGKYNASNAEIKQMRRLVNEGYITRYGKQGKRSTFRLTIQGRLIVDKALMAHNII